VPDRTIVEVIVPDRACRFLTTLLFVLDPQLAHGSGPNPSPLQRRLVHLAGHLSGALGLNYPGFPDSCFAVEFTFVKDVPNVFVDRLYRF